MTTSLVTTILSHLCTVSASGWGNQHLAFVRMLYAIEPGTSALCPFCDGDWAGCRCVLVAESENAGGRTYAVMSERDVL